MIQKESWAGSGFWANVDEESLGFESQPQSHPRELIPTLFPFPPSLLSLLSFSFLPLLPPSFPPSLSAPFSFSPSVFHFEIVSCCAAQAQLQLLGFSKSPSQLPRSLYPCQAQEAFFVHPLD